MCLRHLHHCYQGLVVTAAFWLVVAAGEACQVPVFRFALERWDPDAYTVAIVPANVSGDLSAAEREVVEFLQTARDDHNISANLELRTDDGAANESGGARIDLYYPQKIRGLKVRPIWSGQLTMPNAHLLVDSPARRKIVTRILAGESATWLLVRCGDSKKDKAAAVELTEFIAAAKETLKIPDGVVGRDDAAASGISGDPDNVLRSDVPLQIEFSFVEIDRSDPAEGAFLQMLLNVEDDLGEFSSEPMAFPVFGRGRVLEPLVGKGITRDNALDYAGYVCGACSCEIKDQNPGLDLLVAANWEAALEGSEVVIDKVLPPLEGVASLIDTPNTQTAFAADSKTEQGNSGDESFSLVWAMAITGAIATLAIVFGSSIVMRKKPL
jgi:hypothetical protein